MVRRILEMDALEGEVVLTGGVVAHNPVFARLFAESIGAQVRVPPEPQYVGALGAALYAQEQSRKGA